MNTKQTNKFKINVVIILLNIAVLYPICCLVQDSKIIVGTDETSEKSISNIEMYHKDINKQEIDNSLLKKVTNLDYIKLNKIERN